MHITDRTYLPQYHTLIGHEVVELLDAADLAADTVEPTYNTLKCALYSMNIDQPYMSINTFMNARRGPEAFKLKREVREVDRLAYAYEFAQENPLTEKNVPEAQKIFSQGIFHNMNFAKWRNSPAAIYDESGILYRPHDQFDLKPTMKEFFKEIEELLKTELSSEEAFYHAALIHLKFAHIHPFRDGNGRAARLLEKWFLAEKLGAELWKLPSEKFYKEHQREYYDNINLGVNYYELDYSKCLPFLKMLPESLRK